MSTFFSRRSIAQPAAGRIRRFRPMVEALEDRCVPANLPVVIVPGLGGSLPPNPKAFFNFLDHLGVAPDPNNLTALWDFSTSTNPILQEFKQSPYISLVNALENSQAHYTMGTDLFVCAYDWRLPLAPSDHIIDGKITDVTGAKITGGEGFMYGLDYLGNTLKTVAETWAKNNPGQELPGVVLVGHSIGTCEPTVHR
jgi:hypothetical protein